MKVSYLLGFDTEAPYGDEAHTEKGAIERERTVSVVKKLNTLLDGKNITRTHFLLGSFLVDLERVLGTEEVRQLFNSDLIDVQQHSYSHNPFREIPTRPDKKALDAAEMYFDIQKANEVLRTILDKKDLIGVRSPLGYYRGLADEHDKMDAVLDNGMIYISSDLRDKNGGIFPPLVENGKLRQPYRYQNGLLEIPGHGWHDTAFLGSKTKGVPKFNELPRKELEAFIVDHYTNLVREGLELAEAEKRDIYIGSAFHPQAMAVYDPELELFSKIIENHEKLGAKVCAYTEIINNL